MKKRTTKIESTRCFLQATGHLKFASERGEVERVQRSGSNVVEFPAIWGLGSNSGRQRSKLRAAKE